MAKSTLISKLTYLTIKKKLLFLGIIAALLFLPNLLLNHINLKLYYVFYTVFIGLLCRISFIILDKQKISMMLKLWAVGTIVYLLFAIPRIYLTCSLSPYFSFVTTTDRWLYSLLLPLLLLGTLTIGTVFIQITKPSEFLCWGRYGIVITVLVRSLQHATQVFNDTKIALMLQNEWPEKNSNVFNPYTTWQIIKFSPLFVSTSIRNIILYWFPWGWLCLEEKLKHIKNKQNLTPLFSLKNTLTIILAGATVALTIFVRIPTPATGGYLNIADMAVIFCGLFLGGRFGAIAGGVGSAIADITGGFFIFAPITLIAKGLEAYIAGTLGKKHPLWLILAEATMVLCYFIAEIFLPGMGLSAALSALPFNLIQGTIGAIGGLLIYKGVVAALPK